MEFREREGISFEEAERRHAELARCYEAGQIDEEEFDAERQKLLVVDDEGRWWAKSRENGRWHYNEGGGAWIEATPPVFYQRAGSEDSTEQLEPLKRAEYEAQERYCTNCGAPMGSKASFCVSCGEYAVPEAGTYLVSEMAPEQPRQRPATQRSGSSRLLIGLGVLCAVLAVGLIAALAYPLLTGEDTAGGTEPKTDSTPAASSVPPNTSPEPVPQQGKPGGSGAGSPSPSASSEEKLRAAVRAYYEAVDREDWDYTYDNLDSETKQKYTRDEYVRKNQYLASVDPLSQSSPEITSKVSTSSPVEVTLDQTFESGLTRSRVTYFLQEDGSWKHRFSREDDAVFLPDASYDEFVRAKQSG